MTELLIKTCVSSTPHRGNRHYKATYRHGNALLFVSFVFMSKLYSYILRYDDGAAPNPFWGFCTLTVCKPAIRQTASVGDWVIGTGSANAVCNNGQRQDLSGSLVYAMKITRILSLEEYDWYCREKICRRSCRILVILIGGGEWVIAFMTIVRALFPASARESIMNGTGNGISVAVGRSSQPIFTTLENRPFLYLAIFYH